MTTGARKLAKLDKAEEIADDRFAASILIEALRMQTVAATACFEIHDRQGEIVAAEEPGEGLCSFFLPNDVVADPPCGMTCSDRRCGLQRLLIEELYLSRPI